MNRNRIKIVISIILFVVSVVMIWGGMIHYFINFNIKGIILTFGGYCVLLAAVRLFEIGIKQ